MATKKEIKECIALIEHMDVQINYRDEEFLNAAGLAKTTVKNNTRKGQSKVQYSFDEILANIPNEVRVVLEEDYRRKKNAYALLGNDRLVGNKKKGIKAAVPDAKEQIAKAFIPFIDEVQKELDWLITMEDATKAGLYLESDAVIDKKDGKTRKRLNRGLHLVYISMKSREELYEAKVGKDFEKKTAIEDVWENDERVPAKEEYSFSTLPALLDVIAKVTTEYCRKMDAENEKDRTERVQGKAKRGQIAPLFIRQSCAWVCFALLYFGETLSKYFKLQPLSKMSGVCSQIMHDLHMRTKYTYGYEYFVKEKKLFEYNKWSILPELILREGGFTAPISPINYAGHKDGFLGFMLQSLVNQRKFDVYLEPFGGGGTGIVQFEKKEKVCYFLSDANYSNMCYYRMLKANDADFDFCISEIEKVQSKVDALYSKIDALHMKDPKVRSHFKNMSDKGFEQYYVKGQGFDSSRLTDEDVVSFFCNKVEKEDERFPVIKEEAKVALEVHYALKDLYRPYFDLYTFTDNHLLEKEKLSASKTDWKNYAVAFVVLHTSKISGRVTVNQSIRFQPALRNLNVRRQFTFMREAFAKVEPEPDAEYGADAMRLLESAVYNKEQVLTYLDSPYLNTSGYGSRGFEIGDIENLMHACMNFKGDLIYSCRVNMKNKRAFRSKKARKNFSDYFDWWLQAKEIFNRQGKPCKVLFLCESVDYSKWNPSMELYMYMLREGIARPEDQYLAYCMENGENLEVMITNFDFQVPDFKEFQRTMPSAKLKAMQSAGKNLKGTTLMLHKTFTVEKDLVKDHSVGTFYSDKTFVKADIEDVAKLVKFIYR